MRKQDASGTVEAQAVGTGQQQWVLKKLQADWAGQLRLQCVHPFRRSEARRASAKSREAGQLSEKGGTQTGHGINKEFN